MIILYLLLGYGDSKGEKDVKEATTEYKRWDDVPRKSFPGNITVRSIDWRGCEFLIYSRSVNGEGLGIGMEKVDCNCVPDSTNTITFNEVN